MKSFALTIALGASCLGLAACGGYGDDDYNNAANADYNAETANADYNAGAAANTSYTTTTTSVFAPGARIVEEGGVTFRIDPDGTRVRLGADDARILVEDGVRYRVDPGGTRVRIGDDGAELSVPVSDDLAVEVNTTP